MKFIRYFNQLAKEALETVSAFLANDNDHLKPNYLVVPLDQKRAEPQKPLHRP